MTTEDFEIIPQFDYAYDAAGRRVSIVKSGSAFGDLSGSVDSYAYNDRSELTSARRTKNGQPIPGFSEDFDYDPIGNRRSSATYNEKGVAQTSTYQANNLNQYTQRTTPGYAAVRGEADPAAFVTVNENPTFRLGSYYFGSDLFDNTSTGGLANLETYATLAQTVENGEEAEDLVSATTNRVYLAQSPETFAYDDDGNQTLITTKTGLWRVTYNGENRPIHWVRDSDNTTLTMSYDHMGRRREKNSQHFFYDGYLQIANSHSPTPTQSSNCYIWDCTETITTRPLVWTENDLSSYYDLDGNKNVSEVVAADGAVSAHYEYAPFGAVTTQRGTFAATNPWRFSSEYDDDDISLMYYNYRHYDLSRGRWLTIDPLTETGSENLYAFCRNVATLWTDVLGMVGDAGDTFFSGSAMDFQLSSYVDVSFNTMPLNGDYAERITIQFVARFTPPKEITVFPIGGKGRNAIGGFNNMFVPYNSADVPQEVWGEPDSVTRKGTWAGFITYSYYTYGNKKFRYGYFVHSKEKDDTSYSLVYENDDMYNSWSTEIIKLGGDDVTYSVDRRSCEMIKFSYGDRGVTPQTKEFGP